LAEDKVNQLVKAESDEIKPEINRQYQWFKDNQFMVSGSRPGKPLTEKQKEILEEVLKPNSTIIVWDVEVRFRNRLIVRTYWQTGVRKSELMCFKLQDFPGNRTLNLTKRPNDPEDLRKDKGKVKTIPRTLNIASSHDQMIQDYILEYRQPSRKRVRHKFIFTSLKGSPISVSAIDNIFKQLRKVEGLEDVSPHDLRHDLATDLRKRYAAQGLKDEVAEDYMRGVFGWGPKSKMAAHYTRELAGTTIRAMSEERQERLDK
jgi:integrase